MEEKKNWYDPIPEEDFNAGKVSNLSNRPNQTGAYGVGGLSSQDLKAWFDKSSTLLKDKLNELLVAITSGDMADELKVDLTDGITSLQALCDAIKSGEISDILPVKGEDVGTSMTLNAVLSRVYERASNLEAGAVKGATVSGEGDLIRIDLLNKDNASVAGADVSCGLELNAEKNELSVVFKDKDGAVLARSAPVTIIELAEDLSGNDTDKAPSVQAVNEGIASSQSAMTKYVDDELQDVKANLVAQTLDGNDTDKAPSVKSVKNEFDAVKEDLETTIIEVGTIAERVQEIDLKVGQSYKTVKQSFHTTSIEVNAKHVGTHVAFSKLAPSYGYKGTKAAPISNPYVESFIDDGDWGYDPSVYEVSTSINSGKLRISINSLTEDLDGYGIAVFFDSLAINPRQVVGLGVTVVSGSFTSELDILAIELYSKIKDDLVAGFEFENVNSERGSEKKFMNLASTTKDIGGLYIDTLDGEMFTNYVIDVDLYLEPEIVCEVPLSVSSAGKSYLEDVFSRAAILAEEAGASLTMGAFDSRYRVRCNSFDLDAMEIEARVVQTEDGLVCLDEPRYIPVAAPLFNLVFPATAGEEISLHHTSAMNGIELHSESEILYVAKS